MPAQHSDVSDAALIVARDGGVDLVRPTVDGTGLTVVASAAVRGRIMIVEVMADAGFAWVASDVDGVGLLTTFALSRDALTMVGEPVGTRGGLPCSIAVVESPLRLVVANYGGAGDIAGDLCSFTLDATGRPVYGGSWSDAPRPAPPTERHTVSHPHHVEFVDGVLRLIDMGNDRITWFTGGGFTDPIRVDLERGWGPRWGCAVGEQLVVGAEIESVLIQLTATTPGEFTRATVVPGATHDTNHLSELVAVAPDRVVVGARGSALLMVLAVSSDSPAKVMQTVEVPGAWPTSLSYSAGTLFVACRDSGQVFGYEVRDGVLRGAASIEAAFAAPSAVRVLPAPDAITI